MRPHWRKVIALAGLLCSSAAPGSPVAVPLDLTFTGVGRPDARLSDYRGDVVVIHFWATWCRPCRREIPSLIAFYNGPYRQLEPLGLVVLTVSNDVRSADLERFLGKYHPPFPVFYDSLARINDRIHLRALPATVIIDRSGRVMARVIGEQDWTDPLLLKKLAGYVQP